MRVMANALRPSNDSANLVGIAAMIGSSAAFVANDTCVKQIADTLPLGEIIASRNAVATAVLVALGMLTGGLTRPRGANLKPIGWRMFGDLMATVLFLAGLVVLPIGEATALGQITPLAMTAAAALLYKEPVGWRRWTAIMVGLFGVLLIIRPGAAAFSPGALLILSSVGFVILRDLASRQTGPEVSTTMLAALSTAGTTVGGLALWPFETWVAPSLRELAFASASGGLLALAHVLVIIAMRTGDVATVAPFRYSIILFALLSGLVVWGELPDGVQMLGIAIVTAAGIYTVIQSRRLALTPEA
jgi:drug/metabolite transporter (DMT)-like permease